MTGEYLTKNGYKFPHVSSAMQKAIRRGDALLAGHWALELLASGYYKYVWKRLLIISAEDCAGVITQEIEALHRAFVFATEREPIVAKKAGAGRIFVAKAVIILCQHPKSRDADHLCILVYDLATIPAACLIHDYDYSEKMHDYVPIPGYALDVHTREGKRDGKTKAQFVVEEHDALTPRQVGLFDSKVEKVRRGETKIP